MSSESGEDKQRTDDEEGRSGAPAQDTEEEVRQNGWHPFKKFLFGLAIALIVVFLVTVVFDSSSDDAPQVAPGVVSSTN